MIYAHWTHTAKCDECGRRFASPVDGWGKAVYDWCSQCDRGNPYRDLKIDYVEPGNNEKDARQYSA
jgi:hypothetical protein